MSEAAFHLVQGAGPLVLSAPHPGLDIPGEIAARLTPEALDQIDADHAVHELYDFAQDLGATTVTARYSRYVVDLNRPPDDASLYPGQTTTSRRKPSRARRSIGRVRNPMRRRSSGAPPSIGNPITRPWRAR